MRHLCAPRVFSGLPAFHRQFLIILWRQKNYRFTFCLLLARLVPMSFFLIDVLPHQKFPPKDIYLLYFLWQVYPAPCVIACHILADKKMASAKAVRPLLKPPVLNFEQPAAVLIRGACNVFGSTALDFRYLLRDVLQIPRIVPLPAHRHWTEIRAVRLKQQPVYRAQLHHLKRLSRVLISHGSIESQVPAATQQFLRHLRGTGKAVEHAAQLRIAVDELKTVAVRFAVVDDYGLTE